MASVTKFTRSAVYNQIRHLERTIQDPVSNPDIDKARSYNNYVLTPERDCTPWQYYKHRLKELYVYGRDDVKVAAGWIVTAPQDLPESDTERFFALTRDFLAERYGPENEILCTVHMDEATPHLHYLFVPVVEDNKHANYDHKVCANDLLNRKELLRFHPDLHAYLKANGLNASVTSGVTAANGRNYTVAELKAQRDHEHQVEDRWSQNKTNTYDYERW